jgi:hypothetical protein
MRKFAFLVFPLLIVAAACLGQMVSTAAAGCYEGVCCGTFGSPPCPGSNTTNTCIEWTKGQCAKWRRVNPRFGHVTQGLHETRDHRSTNNGGNATSGTPSAGGAGGVKVTATPAGTAHPTDSSRDHRSSH